MGHRRPGLSVKLWLAFTMLMAYCNYAFVFSECLNVHLFPVSALLQTQGSVGNIKFLLLCPVFLPSTFYFPSALCLHFFHLRPAPLTTSLIFLPLWKSLGAAVGIYTACVALVHTFCSSGGMFFSLGPKPMASPATLKQNTAEAGESGGGGGGLQRWHFSTLVPGLLTTPLQPLCPWGSMEIRIEHLRMPLCINV